MSEHVPLRPRISLGVTRRETFAGDIHHVAGADHVVTLHAGPPVQVACPSTHTRALKTRGDLHLMPAGASDFWMEDGASTAVELRIPPSLLRLAAEDMGLDPDRVGLEPRDHFRDAQIEHIAWALEADSRANTPNGLLYRESLGLALAARLLASYRTQVEAKGGLSAAQRQRIIEYVEAHLDESLSLERLSRVVGLSASHFKTLFRRSMGLPVHEYVVQRRVERARTLLLRGELSTGEVALEAGFSHQSHMARCMRRILGVTPGVIARSRA
ncbi:helix-turn-helix domain-containing protein [Myxococcus sp. Y35]|uniref:helix-turn-helix domain-containing protein n=1 Tax=Pseudomyxococcus flavus TaxID=3115648 RepID=UPI003CF028A4